MVFSSSIFIFLFLPTVLLAYYLLRPWRIAQNIILVITSLFFYAWGEPKIVFLMILSIIVNYVFGLLVDRFRKSKIRAYATIILMLSYNLGILFVFKYLNFVASNIGLTLNYEISLPIGISFYTFQAISYVIDVYRKKGEPQKNPLNVALYIAFFPQLIAGPIVRYETIAYQIKYRKETLDNFTCGVKRFIQGLGKKLILANSFAPIADFSFGHINELSVISAWIGIICYTMQIYFDFSGYSDMAIGLGKMFGFEFQENFDYPYMSKSITEFWRRWHISLGTWFRDYVYIPLGGSRVKNKSRLVFNLFVVWTLTGIWHGANWTFLVWGLWYFILLTFEKLSGILKKEKTRIETVFSHIFTMFGVMFGWVIFRAETLNVAFLYLQKMFFSTYGFMDNLACFLLNDSLFLIIIGGLFCTPFWDKIIFKLGVTKKHNWALEICSVLGHIALFLLCIGYAINSSYNPFIYFNF